MKKIMENMSFLGISGVLFWILISLILIGSLLFKKKLLVKFSKLFVFGPSLKENIDKLIDEYPSNIKKETISNVLFGVIRRITRAFSIPLIFGLIFGLIPYIFLYQQNKLFSLQNELISKQNILFNRQNKMTNQQVEIQREQVSLFKNQNSLLENQNEAFALQNKNSHLQYLGLNKQNTLIEIQDSLIGIQTKLLKEQNELVTEQGELTVQQIGLGEADRRSSSRDLLFNLFQQIQKELSYENIDNLSLSTINYIQAVSNIIQPYRYYAEGDLIKKPLSPERAMLLIYISNLNISKEKISQIIKDTNFNYADFSNYDGSFYTKKIIRGLTEQGEIKSTDVPDFSNMIKFGNIRMKNANFSNSDFRFHKFNKAFIENSSFEGAYLVNSDFSLSNLWNVSFTNSDLTEATFFNSTLNNVNFKGANLSNCNFSGAEGISVEKLINTKTLYGIFGINNDILNELKKRKPELFQKLNGGN